ncbi:glycosyltransferase family 39 protein [Streptomyces sp. NPDC059637]|uniref:glycosyltransferase family 39 protein n=1 Tax=Streptomyces sp. NPDC059637 TaxID=3347752 RepID=UPI0036BFF6E9
MPTAVPQSAAPWPGPTAPRPGRARRLLPHGWWGRLVPVVVLLTAVVHLPSFLRPLWNPDEGFLAVQARVLAEGGALYADVVDRKPPLLPWLHRGVLELLGDDLLWPAVRVLAVGAHTATALLLAAAARHHRGDRAGTAAGLLYPLLSVGLAPEDTQAAAFEVFMLPWTAAAYFLAVRGRWGAAGLATAAAALTKQTGGAVLLPVLWLLWQHSRDRRTDPGAPPGAPGVPGALWPGVLRLGAGLLLPVAAAAWATGPRRFVFWTLTGSGSYLSPEGSWPLVLGRALGNAAIAGAAWAAPAAAVVAAGVVAARRRRAADAPAADAPAVGGAPLLWLAASAAAVTTGFQFFGHYYLQLLPPLVLAGACALDALPRRRRPALAWSAAAAAVFLGWGLLAEPQGLRHSLAVAEQVRAHTGERDRILVWGMRPEQYWLAGRRPAGRHLTAGFLTNFSGGRGDARVGERYAVPGAWEDFREDMAEHPPALVVDDSRGAPYAPEHIPTVRRLLDEHYHRVAEADGAVLYARNTAPR